MFHGNVLEGFNTTLDAPQSCNNVASIHIVTTLGQSSISLRDISSFADMMPALMQSY